MLPSRIKLAPNGVKLANGFRRVREEMGLPDGFPEEVERAAAIALAKGSGRETHIDRTEIDLVTIDPPGSKDLDQAFHAARDGSGFLVHYAIADLGWFITPDDPVDRASWERGQTLYAPDDRVRLYPASISEGAASLLPDQARPAVLWEFDLDAEGAVHTTDVHRARVRSRRQMTYEEAQEEIDSGSGSPSVQLLKTIGKLRQKLERARGGIHLELPEQEIHLVDGSYQLTFRGPLPVEEWNAQISLMTGMAAAKLMVAAGVGLLRTLPAPTPEAVEALRRSAGAMSLDWPEGASYQEFLAQLDTRLPRHAAMANIAMRLFQGADYLALAQGATGQTVQHAIGAPYAHVTAPLRRLADRYTNEIALAICRGEAPPSWAAEALPRLPEVMKKSRRRAGELERRIVDFVEAVLLASRIGETFEAVVLEAGEKSGTVQLKEPAVVAHCACPHLDLGSEVRIRLVEADPERGHLRFEVT